MKNHDILVAKFGVKWTPTKVMDAVCKMVSVAPNDRNRQCLGRLSFIKVCPVSPAR